MKTSFWTKLLDLINPRTCVVCQQRLSPNESVLCCTCQLHLPLTRFEQDLTDNRMARLFWGRFPVERAVGWFYYEAQSDLARLIYSMKYEGQDVVARQMGTLVANELLKTCFFEGIDALVPVPISLGRRWKRGYNQSEEIARGVSDVTGIPMLRKVIRRKAFKVSQTHLNALERQQNVEHVFELTDGQAVANKHLLIIDDVVTTGSTVTACALQLLKAGGVKVSVLALSVAK